MRANLINSTQSGKNMGIESRFTEEQIEAFRRFEDNEIDRFLKENFPYKETKIWLPEITKEQFPLVRAETKAGIKAGIDDFLKMEEMEELSLYVADLRKFYYGVHIEEKLTQIFAQSRFNPVNISTYVEEISKGYKGFAYNQSLTLFLSKFHNLLDS